MESNANAQPHGRRYPQWTDEDAKYSDFILETSDHYEFPICRKVLSLKSDVFAAMFDANMSEKGVNRAFIEDITGDAMFVVLKFFYNVNPTWTGLLMTAPTVIDQVYYAAEKYNLFGLKSYCQSQLTCQLSTDSVCNALEMAKMFRGIQLFDGAIHFIRDNSKDPQMPWGQLSSLGDGKILKEMSKLAADLRYIAQP